MVNAAPFPRFLQRRPPRSPRLLGVLCILWGLLGPLALAQGFAPPGAPAEQTPYPATAPAATGSPWQFRPTPPNYAQGVPPGYWPPPAGQQAPAAAPPGAPAGYPPGYPAAYPPHYAPPGYPPGYPHGQRPGQMPGQMPSGAPPWSAYPPAAAPRAVATPRARWIIDERRPYLQQAILTRLEILSDSSLREATLELPATGDLLLMQDGQATAATRASATGREEILTAYDIVLMPLRAGDLDLPPLRITGVQTNPERRFSIESEPPGRLAVRTPVDAVRPWLAMHELKLNLEIDTARQLAPGEPLTVALEVQARGAIADQLPDLESLLRGPGYRLYRERTVQDTRRGRESGSLLARRTDYFTLVPQTGNRLILPEIAVTWWNLEEEQRAVARLPMRTLNLGGGLGGGWFGFGGEPGQPSDWWHPLWVPLAAVLLLLLGYWVGVLFSRRVPAAGGRTRGALLLERLGQPLRAGWRRASLVGSRLLKAARAQVRAWGPAVRTAWSRGRPASSRFLAAVRQANRAADASGWCRAFAAAPYRPTGVPGRDPPARLAGEIARLRPRADRRRLAALLEELEAAAYGRRALDYPDWRRRWMREVSRGLLPWRPVARLDLEDARGGWSGRPRGLPVLNPSGTRPWSR